MAFKMKGPSLYRKSAPLPQRAELSEEDIKRMERKKAMDDMKKESDLKRESIPPATTYVDKDIVKENKPKTKEDRGDDVRDDVKPKKRKKKEPKIKDLKIENKKIDKIDVDIPKDADGEYLVELEKSTPIDPTPKPETKKKKKLTRKEKKKLKEAEEKGKKQVDEYLEGLNK